MKFKYLIASLIAFVPLSLVSCDNSSTPTESEETTTKIVLSATDVNLVVGETYHLSITLTDADMSLETIYTSLNTGVVSVDNNGIVTALSAGTATVEVSKGTATASCQFNVSYDTLVPVISVAGITNNSLELDLSSYFIFDIDVVFAGVKYDIENPTIALETGSEAEVTVEGFKVTPTKKGQGVLKIGGTFRDLTLNPYYIHLNVKDAIVFTLKNEGDTREYNTIELYSLSEFQGKEYETSFKPIAKVYVNGEDVSNEIELTFEGTEGVINYDITNNVITPIAVGNAKLTISYKEYSKIYPIHVNYLYGGDINNNEPYVIDASIGELPSEEIFKDFPGDQTIIKATSEDGEIEYEVDNGKVLGLPSKNFEKQRVVVYNKKVAYVVTFQAYAKIIRTAEDLSCLIIKKESAEAVTQYTNDGYYILANDIDCTGVKYDAHTRVLGLGANLSNKNCGFVGTFDGQGHTITNFEVPKGGMFLILGNNAVVRNVGFKNAILNTTTDNDKFTLATYIYGASISNVYIDCSSVFATVNNALIAGFVASGCNISNCFFSYTGEIKSSLVHSYGSFMHLYESGGYSNGLFTNTYLVSSTPMTVTKKNICDAFNADQFNGMPAGLEYVYVAGIQRYLTNQDMVDANNDYSSFDSKYWDYETEAGKLIWKF